MIPIPLQAISLSHRFPSPHDGLDGLGAANTTEPAYNRFPSLFCSNFLALEICFISEGSLEENHTDM